METVCVRECVIVCEDTWIYSGHYHIAVHRSIRAPSPERYHSASRLQPLSASEARRANLLPRSHAFKADTTYVSVPEGNLFRSEFVRGTALA